MIRLLLFEPFLTGVSHKLPVKVLKQLHLGLLSTTRQMPPFLQYFAVHKDDGVSLLDVDGDDALVAVVALEVTLVDVIEEVNIVEPLCDGACVLVCRILVDEDVDDEADMVEVAKMDEEDWWSEEDEVAEICELDVDDEVDEDDKVNVEDKVDV